ncbi:MAG: MFS transporter, partial [Deferrisomatales bacterium]
RSAREPGGGDAHPGAPPAVLWASGVVPLGLAIGVPYFVCGFTDLGLFSTHFVPLAEGRGFSGAVVAWALGVDAAANLVGNLVAGHLADRIRVPRLLAAMYALRALALVYLLRAADPASILLFAALHGSVEASTIAPTAALCAQAYGPGRVGAAFGAISAVHQLGAAAGAFLVGALYSASGSYGLGLGLAAALLAAGSALVLTPRPLAPSP